jgi:site-specific DNA-methyltransferase (adenine-specific)
LDFYIHDEIIWNKAASAGGSCAWGSWKSASNPSLRDIHEYIIIATKECNDLNIPKEDLDKFPEKLENRKLEIDLNEYFQNIWTFGTESAKRVNHPAPFPVELPYRIIMMYSKRGDIILDPFMGSGTVAIASIIANRYYIGYDLNQEYIDRANNRIAEFKRSLKTQKRKQNTPNKRSNLTYYLNKKD